MKLLILSLLVGTVVSAPTSNESSSSSEENSKVKVTTDFFVDEFKIYSSAHDIVQILVPLNSLNFPDDLDSNDSDESDSNTTIFIVEADIKDGVKEYKGVSTIINNKATKVLATGTDVAASNDDSTSVYIAATDGLYVYKNSTRRAEKIEPITDSLIGIAKVNGTAEIYILTDKNEVFKVNEDGSKKTKVDSVVGAKQIVLDYSNNLYFYGEDKLPYVLKADGAKKITGLPANPTKVELLKPAFVLEDGVPFIVDNKAYVIYANGTSEGTDFEFDVIPTAYSMEATLVQYYGYNKSVYEYNIIRIILGEFLDELKNYLREKESYIDSIKTRAKNDPILTNQV